MSAETVQLPKDREGRTLHIDNEVLVCCGGNPVAQGEVMSLTLALLDPAVWYGGLHMGAIGDRRYRTRSICFYPHELERIEDDGSDD